uniref:Uncharacterized protein n=1 Tax=Chryseobacterium endophyticum TaxID=1854762 RepID=A0AAU6WQJ3_9FLAO
MSGLFLVGWGSGYGLHEYNGNPEGFLYPLQFMTGSTFFGRSTEFFFGMLLAYLMKQEKGLGFLKNLKKPTLIGGISILLLNVAITFLPVIISFTVWNDGKED